ncbi:MAG: response regulator transcription factor [Tissierellia bacterium]|nr:response regulator transcription factor [Tissierellia bacterium]
MKVIIIDDDPLVVNSLNMIVEANGIEVLATGNDGSDALELYRVHRPDIVLMDIRMSNINGIEATEKLLEFDNNAKVLLITTFQDKEYIESALKLGCKGYILKENIKGIIPAINAIHSGNMVFDSKIVSSISAKNTTIKLDVELSDREKDILTEIAEGLNNKEIAEKLFLSEGTVRNYISLLLDKLELRDRTQLAIYYYKTR